MHTHIYTYIHICLARLQRLPSRQLFRHYLSPRPLPPCARALERIAVYHCYYHCAHYMCVCVRVCACTCMCMYVYVRVRTCVSYVCTCVCTCVYICKPSRVHPLAGQGWGQDDEHQRRTPKRHATSLCHAPPHRCCFDSLSLSLSLSLCVSVSFSLTHSVRWVRRRKGVWM